MFHGWFTHAISRCVFELRFWTLGDFLNCCPYQDELSVKVQSLVSYYFNDIVRNYLRQYTILTIQYRNCKVLGSHHWELHWQCASPSKASMVFVKIAKIGTVIIPDRQKTVRHQDEFSIKIQSLVSYYFNDIVRKNLKWYTILMIRYQNCKVLGSHHWELHWQCASSS